MKKITLLIAIVLVSLISVKGNVTITLVTINPSSPADTQHVYAVVSAMFTSGGCPLMNSFSFLQGDTVHLVAYYQVGSLSVICNATDTFDLGLLPCTTHTLHVTVIESGSATGTDDDHLPLTVSCTAVGIPGFTLQNDLLIFPNPVSGELNVQIKENKISPAKLSVLNLLGEVVCSSNDLHSSHEQEKRIDVRTLAKGMYFLKVENTNGIRLKKFLKE